MGKTSFSGIEKKANSMITYRADADIQHIKKLVYDHIVICEMKAYKINNIYFEILAICNKYETFRDCRIAELKSEIEKDQNLLLPFKKVER